MPNIIFNPRENDCNVVAGRELDLSTNACRTVHSQFPLLTFKCCPNGHIKLNKKSSS